MSSNYHLITREIGIDMGHRVPHHGSKCKSIHGHRYKIVATCEGQLFKEGEQQGMVLDFGFLKDEMMKTIDYLCDHGTVLWEHDELVDLIYPEFRKTAVQLGKDLTDPILGITGIRSNSCKFLPLGICRSGKIVIVPFTPTAENLAKWWFELLEPKVEERSGGKAKLVELKVWETPFCSAIYPNQRI